jgi:hypothetical protein
MQEHWQTGLPNKLLSPVAKELFCKMPEWLLCPPRMQRDRLVDYRLQDQWCFLPELVVELDLQRCYSKVNSKQ